MDPSRRVSLDITRSLISHLFHLIKAHPWALWLISTSNDGFHRVPGGPENAGTFIFGFINSILVWTFSPATALTRVPCVRRSGSTHRAEVEGVSRPGHAHGIFSLLPTLAPHLCTPFVPLMAAVVATLLPFDALIVLQSAITDRVESIMASSQVRPARFEVLADMMGHFAAVRVHLVDLMRNHDHCMRALCAVTEAAEDEERQQGAEREKC